MKILVTGGAGFVGSSLALAFRAHDPAGSVTAFDNLKRRGSELNLPILRDAGIRFVHGDIRTQSDLNDLPDNYDLLIEASAEPSVQAGMNGAPDYLIQTNLTGTINCLEFARRRVGATVFLSTSRVYSIQPMRELRMVETATRFEVDAQQNVPGVSAKGISELFPTHLARSLYGATKLASELLIQEYAFAYGLKAVINRCGVIAGPGQFGKVDQGVFTLWVAHHFFGRPLAYLGFGGKGKQVRDLMHPSDLFALLQLQIPRISDIAGQVFNVGGGHEGSVSLLELTQLCQEVVGRSIPIGSKDVTSPVDVPYYVSDATLAQTVFGWKPQKSVRAIVTEIHHWLSKNEAQLRPLFTT